MARLKILPLQNVRELKEECVFCNECLCFDRDDRIFSQIKNYQNRDNPTVKVQPIPRGMWIETYRGSGIERSRNDECEEELTFAYAKELKKLKMLKDTSPRNMAIKAFINALPDDVPIFLDWW